MTDETHDPDKAVNFIIANAPKFAKAKAERIFVEEFRRSKKAILMGQCDAKTATEREQYAYSNSEYLDLLEGLREAVELEETLKWQLIAAQARIEIYRTKSANNRLQDKATQ